MGDFLSVWLTVLGLLTVAGLVTLGYLRWRSRRRDTATHLLPHSLPVATQPGGTQGGKAQIVDGPVKVPAGPTAGQALPVKTARAKAIVVSTSTPFAPPIPVAPSPQSMAEPSKKPRKSSTKERAQVLNISTERPFCSICGTFEGVPECPGKH
jgi:hypothetical protein